MRQESTQQERFKYMREEFINLSQAQLAKKLGLNNQQRIADIETGRKQKIDSGILQILSSEYLINLEWLLFGTGFPTKVEENEYYAMQYGGEYVTSIPFYDVNASAGTGEMCLEEISKNVLYFDTRWLQRVLGACPKYLSIIKAKGNSMDGGIYPIKDGDLLLVDSSIKQGNNKVFVFRENNELFVKQLHWNIDGSIDIISFNETYNPRTIDEITQGFTNFEIIGRVIWNGSKETI